MGQLEGAICAVLIICRTNIIPMFQLQKCMNIKKYPSISLEQPVEHQKPLAPLLLNFSDASLRLGMNRIEEPHRVGVPYRT